MNGKIAILAFLAISLGLANSANFIYDQGTNVMQNGQLVGSADLTIQIWNESTGGAMLWEKNYSNGIVNGSWNVLMDNLDFSKYGVTYYKDYKIDNVDLDFSGSERIAFMLNMGDISSNHVVKDSGTNWLMQTLTSILDSIYNSLIWENTTDYVKIKAAYPQNLNITNTNKIFVGGGSIYWNGTDVIIEN